MPSYRSKYVHQIGWQIKTSNIRDAGTDSRVTVTILRDGARIIALNLEPGNTTRLDQGESAFYFWRFQGTVFEPGDLVEWIAGMPYPDGVEFADDVQGHLTCDLRIHGDDMWVKDQIDAYVRYINYHHIPGTIDAFEWVPDLNWTFVATFPRDIALSTDKKEGVTILHLIY